jgi:hypothetical protein
MSADLIGELIKNMPDIIRASASSPLGMVSLGFILVSIVSLTLFKNAPAWSKILSFCVLTVFISLFLRVVLKETESYVSLTKSIDAFVQDYDKEMKSGLGFTNDRLPKELSRSRDIFMDNWKSASYNKKIQQDQDKLLSALMDVIDTYRLVQEKNDPVKVQSAYWADQSILFFEDSGNKYAAFRSLLKMADVYLDNAFLTHAKADIFWKNTTRGLEYVEKAAGLANDENKYRVCLAQSSYYYYMARPRDLVLGQPWDQAYLRQSYDKALEAHKLKQDDIGTGIQLCRATVKLSKNIKKPDAQWVRELSYAYDNLYKIQESSGTLPTTRQFRIGQNLGVVSLERHALEFYLADKTNKGTLGELLKGVRQDAIKHLEKTLVLLDSTEYNETFKFDVNYDLARTYSIMTQIDMLISEKRSSIYFEDVKTYLSKSKKYASSAQIDSTVNTIKHEITFVGLHDEQKAELIGLMVPQQM